MTVGDGGGRDGNTAHPDYAALETPDDEPFEDWSTEHRRAYVFGEWTDAGSHQLLNKSRLAEQFGVSRDTLYNDLDAVADHVDSTLGRHHGAQTKAVVERAVAELMDEGEYKKAAKLQLDFGGWLEDRGAIDREPDRSDVRVAATGADDEDLDFLDEVF